MKKNRFCPNLKYFFNMLDLYSPYRYIEYIRMQTGYRHSIYTGIYCLLFFTLQTEGIAVRRLLHD